MSSIDKKNKIRKCWLSVSFIGMISLGIFIQSCNKEDDNVNAEYLYDMDMKYLDLDVTSTTAFTNAELNTIANAIQRIDKHIVFDKDNNKYVFQLKSSAEINVSQRLFDYIYAGIGINPSNVPFNSSNVPRLKGDDLENTTIFGFGYIQSIYSLTHQEALELMQNMNSFFLHAGGAGGATAATLMYYFKASKYATLVAALAGVVVYAEATYWSTAYDNYVNKGNGKGMYFIITTFTAPIIPYATYQFNYK